MNGLSRTFAWVLASSLPFFVGAERDRLYAQASLYPNFAEYEKTNRVIPVMALKRR